MKDVYIPIEEYLGLLLNYVCLYVVTLYWKAVLSRDTNPFFFFTENAADADSYLCGVLCTFTVADEDMII